MAQEDFEGGLNGTPVTTGNTILDLVDADQPPLFSNEHARDGLSAGPPATFASPSGAFGFLMDNLEPTSASGWCYLTQNLDEPPGIQITNVGCFPLAVVVGADFGLGTITYFPVAGLTWIADPEGFDTMDVPGLYWAHPDEFGSQVYDPVLSFEGAVGRWLQFVCTVGTAGGLLTMTDLSVKDEGGATLWAGAPEQEVSVDISAMPYVIYWGGQSCNPIPGEVEGVGLARSFAGAWVDDLVLGDVTPQIEGRPEDVRRIFT